MAVDAVRRMADLVSLDRPSNRRRRPSAAACWLAAAVGYLVTAGLPSAYVGPAGDTETRVRREPPRPGQHRGRNRGGQDGGDAGRQRRGEETWQQPPAQELKKVNKYQEWKDKVLRDRVPSSNGERRFAKGAKVWGVVTGFLKSGAAVVTTKNAVRGCILDQWEMDPEWGGAALGQKVGPLYVIDFSEKGSVFLSAFQPRRPCSELRIGENYTGTVVKFANQTETMKHIDAVYVDVGFENDGLMLTKFMTKEHRDVVHIGQEVNVTVRDIQPFGDRFSLIMAGTVTPMSWLEINQEMSGTVRDIGKLKDGSEGALVDIGSERHAWLDFEECFGEKLTIGARVTVYVHEVVPERKMVVLSMFKRRTPIEEVKVGQEFNARVLRRQGDIFFADIGTMQDVAIHHSAAIDEKLWQELKVGSETTVWISTNDGRGKVCATLDRPKYVRGDLKKHDFVTGFVIALHDDGAYVDVGWANSGLLFARSMKEEGIKSASEVLEIGEEIGAWVEGFSSSGNLHLTTIEPEGHRRQRERRLAREEQRQAWEEERNRREVEQFEEAMRDVKLDKGKELFDEASEDNPFYVGSDDLDLQRLNERD